MIILGILSGMRGMVPKFAFLVLENGLRSPQFEVFFRNWNISLIHTAFFSGAGHILFGDYNMIIWGILRGMRSLGPKFAFLVLEIGLRSPPI